MLCWLSCWPWNLGWPQHYTGCSAMNSLPIPQPSLPAQRIYLLKEVLMQGLEWKLLDFFSCQMAKIGLALRILRRKWRLFHLMEACYELVVVLHTYLSREISGTLFLPGMRGLVRASLGALLLSFLLLLRWDMGTCSLLQGTVLTHAVEPDPLLHTYLGPQVPKANTSAYFCLGFLKIIKHGCDLWCYMPYC